MASGGRGKRGRPVESLPVCASPAPRSAAERRQVVKVGGAVTRPTAAPEPDVKGHSSTVPVLPSSGSSVHEPLLQARHWRQLLAPDAWQLHVWRWTFRPVFSPEWAQAPVCLRPSLLLHRCLLVYRPHVSISLALPGAFASWGILLRLGLRPGRLLPYPGEHRTVFPVPDVHFTWL